MNDDTEAIRLCLCALAEAREQHFYALSLALQRRAGVRVEPAAFRVCRSAVSDAAAYVVLGMEAHRRDGVEVCWSVGADVVPGQAEVFGAVEVTEDASCREVFVRRQCTSSAVETATLLKAFAAEVCAQDAAIELLL